MEDLKKQLTYFSVGIAVLYGAFFYKAAQFYTDRDGISNICSGKNYDGYKNYNQCYKDNNIDLRLKEADNKIFYALIVIGIIGIILGTVLQKNVISVGIGMGGLLTIMIAILYNWNNMDEKLKLVVLGSGLISLIGFAYYFLN